MLVCVPAQDAPADWLDHCHFSCRDQHLSADLIVPVSSHCNRLARLTGAKLALAHYFLIPSRPAAAAAPASATSAKTGGTDYPGPATLWMAPDIRETGGQRRAPLLCQCLALHLPAICAVEPAPASKLTA